MRVLHVHSGNIFGGIETFLLTQARYQHLVPDLEFEFALCFGGRFRDELTETGVPIHDLGAVRLRDPLSVRRARRNLEQLLKDNDFDAIVTHSCWAQTGFGPTLRRSTAPLVFYMHAPPNGRHWLERTAKRTQPDLVLCNSRFTADSVALLYPNAKSEVTFYPVPPPKRDVSTNRSAIRSEMETPEDATVIIQVSRMESWKGHTLHFQALAKLPKTEKWICWVVGGAQRPAEQTYAEDLKKLALQLGIAERVRFVGARNDVDNLLAAADIFCQPNTVGEPFGISFIEALYAGLPVVTCDIGASPEIIDETCGIRVPNDNVELLAQQLQRLIQNPNLRSQLGRGGRGRAEHLCDPVKQLRQFQGAINSLAHQRQAIA
jgi:glycosyltransferase involved in cell wall biosynthesis